MACTPGTTGKLGSDIDADVHPARRISAAVDSRARDALRRRRADSVPIENVPEAQLAVDPVEPVQKLKLPEALLSPRQREILGMLYDREMDVAEVARALGIDPQTVRSAHHKAMLKLRAHFKTDLEGDY